MRVNDSKDAGAPGPPLASQVSLLLLLLLLLQLQLQQCSSSSSSKDGGSRRSNPKEELWTLLVAALACHTPFLPPPPACICLPNLPPPSPLVPTPGLPPQPRAPRCPLHQAVFGLHGHVGDADAPQAHG